jgi:hypothetical protein
VRTTSLWNNRHRVRTSQVSIIGQNGSYHWKDDSFLSFINKICQFVSSNPTSSGTLKSSLIHRTKWLIILKRLPNNQQSMNERLVRLFWLKRKTNNVTLLRKQIKKSNTANSHKKTRVTVCVCKEYGTPVLHRYIALIVVNPFWKRNCHDERY